MLHPSMTELLEKVDNRYLLVNVAAKRAREIAEDAEATPPKSRVPRARVPLSKNNPG